MSAKPYSDGYIKEAKDAIADMESTRWLYVARSDPFRWLATVDSLQSRLASSEAERDRYKREVMDYEEREAACCPEDFGCDEVLASLRKRLAAAESEAERLRDVLRQTHANYCDSAWTDRGLHAPECLIEHLDDDEPSRPEGEVRDGR